VCTAKDKADGLGPSDNQKQNIEINYRRKTKIQQK